MAPIDEGFRSRVEAVYHSWRKGIEKALVKGQENGFVSKDVNVTSAAMMIVASLEGCMGLAKNAQSKTINSHMIIIQLTYLRQMTAMKGYCFGHHDDD